MHNPVKIEELLKPLSYKEIEGITDWNKRVLFFDPSYISIKREKDRYSRSPWILSEHIFPANNEKICACGCGVKLTGRRTRWATEQCSDFAFAVWAILAGRTATIGNFVRKYYGWNCLNCGCKDKGHEYKNGLVVSDIKIDHIVPVKHGGGFCWLSNYQLLCHKCHVSKTNTDFNWKKKVAV